MGPDGFGSGFACSALRAVWIGVMAGESVGKALTAMASTPITKQKSRIQWSGKAEASMRFRSSRRSVIMSCGPHFLPSHGSFPRIAGTPPRKDRTMDDRAHDVRIPRRIDRRFPRRDDKETQRAGKIGSSIGRQACRYLRNRGKAGCSVSLNHRGRDESCRSCRPRISRTFGRRRSRH